VPPDAPALGRSPSLQILDSLLGRLRRGEGDILYPAGDALEGFEIGPNKITVVGAPPGAGKTALAMQITFEYLTADHQAKVLLANAEMPFDVLLRREITRRSGVPAKAIRFAQLTPRQMDAVEAVASELEPLVSRIEVMEPPYTSEHLAEYWGTPPRLLILDYLQKFAIGDDARIATNAVVGVLRTLAYDGWGILALSATTRTRGKGGSTHDSASLSLASYKESGEIEYNSDACYLLRDLGPVVETHHRIHNVNLDCVKNRHGDLDSFPLVFNMPQMTFGRPAAAGPQADEDMADWSNPFEGVECPEEVPF
jgi:replicative DNA helicase